ncbi:unnamed protein product [Sphenostylis stenocarpa]|uniref:Uncharacterized protein n=1 Tax=Sphenostylis stenocarpa TaxID=92480 RepID=A0AA86S7H4_9FABA|nr:unnamed protein product [Sphenostylis stenocarpa]
MSHTPTGAHASHLKTVIAAVYHFHIIYDSHLSMHLMPDVAKEKNVDVTFSIKSVTAQQLGSGINGFRFISNFNNYFEYLYGIIYPGRPIANVCFKTFGYISIAQAVSFLSDFKLGHYTKISPRSMFMVQVGPRRIFGSQGNYQPLNWFFLGGAIGPILVGLLHKTFPKQSWIPLINLPVLLGAAVMMAPTTALNYIAWIVIRTIFNFLVFRFRKKCWQRYNYVLSAALYAGVAFMAVLLCFTLEVCLGGELMGSIVPLQLALQLRAQWMMVKTQIWKPENGHIKNGNLEDAKKR